MTHNTDESVVPDQGMTLRQAALTAGFALLVATFAAPFAYFYVFPRLVIPGDIAATTQNLITHEGLFRVGLFCYLITFICDLLIAWALYVLLTPANRSVSLLTAWFRLVYTVIALGGLLKLFTLFRLLNTSEYLTRFGAGQLHAQAELLLKSFRYEWNMGMVFFGIHLVLLGLLVYRSGYIPRILGILLAINGVGYLIDCLRPYLYPGAALRFIMILFFGEVIFMLWLLVRGRRIQQQTAPLNAGKS